MGAITLIATLYLSYLYDDLSREIFRVTMMLGFILWAVCAGVCTFYGPFLSTSECNSINIVCICFHVVPCSLFLQCIKAMDILHVGLGASVHFDYG